VAHLTTPVAPPSNPARGAALPSAREREEPDVTEDEGARVADLVARLEAGETLEVATIGELLALDGDRFARGLIGLTWDRLALDRVEAHLDVDERHHQPQGIVHGGVWTAVVESLASIGGALRVASTGQVVVGVNNSTDFLRPHREGRVEAVGTPVHVGRTQQLWQVVISRGSDGKPVARGQVRLQHVDPTARSAS
jgi:1,4-dihydroxy-2-naphthoyl-CoA hydrolase